MCECCEIVSIRPSQGHYRSDPVCMKAEYFLEGPMRLAQYLEPRNGSYWGICLEDPYSSEIHSPIYFCPMCGDELPQEPAA